MNDGGDGGLWIASRVAARASRFDIVTANNQHFDEFEKRRKMRWDGGDLNAIARRLPLDVLRIIEEEYEKKFRLGQLREVLKELILVTAILRYGFDDAYEFVFSSFDKEERVSWSYLDPHRDESEYDEDDEDEDEDEDGGDDAGNDGGQENAGEDDITMV